MQRIHLFTLLGLLALVVLTQFRTRPDSLPSTASAVGSAREATAATAPGLTRRLHSWLDDFRAAGSDQQDGLLPDGVALARARMEAFQELMRTQPAAALETALALDQLVDLPAELQPFVERPFNGIGSIDLLWETSESDDGSLECRHRHRLHLAGRSWDVVGASLREPSPPRRDTPVSGITLGELAVLSPTPVRILSQQDLAAATSLFPIGNTDGTDPVTGRPGSPDHAALIAGKLFQFESPASIEHVADRLVAADREATRNEQWAIEHEFEWLAASEDRNGEEEAPVAASPFMDDILDVLFIRVDFPDLPGEPISQADLQTTLDAVQGHIEEFSYNAATLIPTITPTVYRMPNSGASYATAGDNSGIQEDARALASAHYTLSSYDVIAVYFPDLGGLPGSLITYGGLASIGGSNHWINGTNSTNVILHEFGHNYGLYHSNYWDPSESLAGDYDVPGSREYGDIFDRMGSGSAPEAHFNHFHKNRLQWMPDSKVVDVVGDGIFRLYRFDHANALANPTLAIKVPMGGDLYYWLGYRQLYTSASYNLATGAYIVAENLSQAAETNLIDATPGSASPESEDRKDCGLEVGVPFTTNGVTFEAIARGGAAPAEWIDVQVTFAGRLGMAASDLEVDEQSGTARLVLQRQFSSVGVASVTVSTTDGSATSPADFLATSETVRWEDGDYADKVISVPIRPDAIAEGAESFTVTLSNPTGASLDTLSSSTTVWILDPGERYLTFTPDFFNNSVYATAPLPDGRVLIGGTIGATSGEFTGISNLALLHPDGSVDTSFLTGTGFDGRVRAIAVQPDGRIVIGGEFTSYDGVPCQGLVRLTSSGSIDTLMATPDDGIVRAIALEDDGSIVVGGNFSSYDGVPAEGMIRLTPAGARDTLSPLSLPFQSSWNTDVYAVVAQSDGRLMAAGSFWVGGPTFRSGLARLNSDGTRDESFDPGIGAHTEGVTNQLRPVYAVAPLPNGKYIIGGFLNAYDNTAIPYLARIDADGSLDSSFTPPALDGSVRALVVQPDGSVLAGGSFSSYLVRLDANGAVDPTFAIGTGPLGTVYSTALSGSGELFVGGNFFNFNGLSSRPVIKLAGGLSPYDLWAASAFSAGQWSSGLAGPGEDPDNDGLSNAAERALGTDPNQAGGHHLLGPGVRGSLTIHESGGQQYLQVSVEKGLSNTGAWFAAQLSNDLSSWFPAGPLPGSNAVYQVLEDSPTRFTIRDRTPLGAGDRFVRIGVSQPE